MRPTPTPTLIRAPAPEPRGRRPASPTLVHAALDDQTLLALILERLDPETDPARLAAALLERFGSLGGVAGAAPGELAQASSTGPALRAELTLLREFAVRLARAEACRRPVITSWTALVAYVRAALAHEPREQFRTLFLDRRNILLRALDPLGGAIGEFSLLCHAPGEVRRGRLKASILPDLERAFQEAI